MPLRQPRHAGKLLVSNQLTQYSGELDDGYYRKGLAKRYEVLSSGQYNGTTNIDLTHLISDTGAFTAANQTYTDAGKCSLFKNIGGETIVITGSALNNGTFTTVSATANTVVVASGFVNEPDAPMTTFKKREALSNNCVLDKHTGLMWARYCSTKMGTLSNGQMPWSTKDYDIFQWCAEANLANLAGYSDWRIPNVVELFSLLNWEIPNGLPSAAIFPGWPTDYLWTSTTSVTVSANAMRLNFNLVALAHTSKGTALFCALVRG